MQLFCIPYTGDRDDGEKATSLVWLLVGGVWPRPSLPVSSHSFSGKVWKMEEDFESGRGPFNTFQEALAHALNRKY